MISFLYMNSLLLQIDEATLKALNRVAPAAKRQRAEFVRQAIKTAIRAAEEANTRAAYLKTPDSAAEADDWSTAGAWEGKVPNKK